MSNESDRKARTTEEFEAALKDTDSRYILRLYVAGMTPRSQRAIENIKNIFETNYKGSYDLEVIDIYQHPELAKEAQILAVPMLIKQLPLPIRKLIGDMSDEDRILVGLGIKMLE
ncbi:circadian clock KaiB family protein [Methanoculleus sp.]|uniref:circadian clock KaiB family protein n=1 Tax=Methanoculleus sp. TaxID=90427 RepID=UPI0025DE3933|nr:circadian clock KaiB family protein [Methanoculleus sp.]